MKERLLNKIALSMGAIDMKIDGHWTIDIE